MLRRQRISHWPDLSVAELIDTLQLDLAMDIGQGIALQARLRLGLTAAGLDGGSCFQAEIEAETLHAGGALCSTCNCSNVPLQGNGCASA